jgi:hypothetical protein
MLYSCFWERYSCFAHVLLMLYSGPDLHLAWRRALTWAKFGAFVDSEVMARQMLNVEVATAHFRNMYSSTSAAPALWLLHIDSDELFFSSRFYESKKQRQQQQSKGKRGGDARNDRAAHNAAGLVQHFEALTSAGFRQVLLANSTVIFTKRHLSLFYH